MVFLISSDNTVQDLLRFFCRGFFDLNRLKTPLQSGILLDILMVLIQRCSAYELNLSSGQGRLKDVGGIDRAFRASGPDKCVHFIDKQDDIAGFNDLGDHSLDPLLKFSSVLGTCDHSGEVHCKKSFILYRGGHISVYDPLRESFDDRSLSDARLSDQAGIVLGPSAQDLDHSADLIFSPDHRIELSFSRQFRQIPAVLRKDPLILGIR